MARINNTLTERDVKFIELLGQGKSDREIGEILDISIATVNKNFPIIMLKMDACNRYNLLYKAFKTKIIK